LDDGNAKINLIGSDSDNPDDNGDVVLDFSKVDAYSNIDFSGDKVIVMLTGSVNLGIKGTNASKHIYATLVGKTSK
jgi:hypothetical protein